MKRYAGALYRLLKAATSNPRMFAEALNAVPAVCSAHNFSRAYTQPTPVTADTAAPPANPLWDYFQNHKEGPGIWKWEHYFDVYHRHFARFVGQKVDVLEIGIYSGGSLGMWRSYFGEKCHVYGVDIEEACRAYASDYVSVFIGDQADRAFWRTFKTRVDGIDILIDDGGHTHEQQQITLEEMLPHLRPGGVYLCEDVQGRTNGFAAFASGLVHELNCMNADASLFQSSIHSIHFYPYLVVIEKHRARPTKLAAPKHGTEWQPFL
jgi:SAM-dependent methyltransferase